MIDMISKGRLVSGFVRGGGQEQLAAGVNPAFNRERFQEARDLVVAAWTREGRSAGKARITSIASSTRGRCRCSRIRGSGSRGSSAPRRSSGRRSEAIPTSRSTPRSTAPSRSGRSTTTSRSRAGFTPGPDYHGMLKQIHVAETEEKALKNAAQFRWMQGEFTGLAHPVWSTPSGYGSPENRRAFVEFASGRSKNPRYRRARKQLEDLMIIAGTPKQVIAKLRILLRKRRGPAFSACGGMTAPCHTRTPRPASG